jgi:hypothetical protein
MGASTSIRYSRARKEGEMGNGNLFNFEILDTVKPRINGKDTYQRILIRRVPSTGEKVISICKICEDYMAERGEKRDLNECDRCALEVEYKDVVFSDIEEAQ